MSKKNINMKNQDLEYEKNVDLHSPKIISKVLQFVHHYAPVSSKPIPIINKEDLNEIKSDNYIVCPQFAGTRSWVVFMKINHIYYSVSFPKYGKNNNVILYPVHIGAAQELYAGTLMEGTYFSMKAINNILENADNPNKIKYYDNNQYLIIDDVYLFAGQDLSLKTKDDRLKYLSHHFYIRQSRLYQLLISQYFYITKKGLRKLYDTILGNNRIEEIVFYPQNLGNKIYTYTITEDDLKEKIIKYSKFYLKKTNNPDVYYLLTLQEKEKVGIAYIPDMGTSKKCRKWLKNKKEILVRCQLYTHKNKNKWIPIEQIIY
jgi:hypothetical protein